MISTLMKSRRKKRSMLQFYDRETIDDKKLVYVYEGTLYIIDTSIISKKEVLKIKMFTNDLKSTFFD